MPSEKQYEFSAVLSPELVREIGADLRRVYPAFDDAAFVAATVPRLEGQLIKARGQVVAEQLHRFLPDEPARAIELLTQSLGPKLGDAANFGSAFKYLPHGTYVSQYGTEPDAFDAATRFLYEMTQRFSAEFAIRPFLGRYPERMLPLLDAWSKDPNQHVRRLVSEGTRPRLPWAMRVKVYDADYAPVWTLLERLQRDPALYVRRSVANHLNDLTKDRAAIVLDQLERWHQAPHEHLDWVTRHALRTLLKQGHPRALALLGFRADAAVGLEDLALSQPQLLLGDAQHFKATLVSQSDQPQPLLVDYRVYFKKANGQLQHKVFKLKTLTLGPGERRTLEKKHVFKPLSTRRHYPGEHRIAIQVNGCVLSEEGFELVFPEGTLQ